MATIHCFGRTALSVLFPVSLSSGEIERVQSLPLLDRELQWAAVHLGPRLFPAVHHSAPLEQWLLNFIVRRITCRFLGSESRKLDIVVRERAWNLNVQ